MADYDQIPFSAAEFAENPEPRCPCLLLLDTSASMNGEPIAELNEGLVTFKDELMADAMAAKRVEVAIVTFGGGSIVGDAHFPAYKRLAFLSPASTTPTSAKPKNSPPTGA